MILLSYVYRVLGRWSRKSQRTYFVGMGIDVGGCK